MPTKPGRAVKLNLLCTAVLALACLFRYAEDCRAEWSFVGDHRDQD